MPSLSPERGIARGRCFLMEKPQDYRKFAEECRRLAKQVTNQQHRAILEQMAEVWLRLAADAEQKDRESPD